ncbi:MAG: choice-of-anchor tandem repeat GloVer-containing protein [Candidatus Sulfotelmatobacter sp.]
MRNRKVLIVIAALLCLALFGSDRRAAAQEEKVLFNFAAGADGEFPYAGLIFDSAGNLYGTTFGGGTYRWGTVFELTSTPVGWSETVLHNFNYYGTDGSQPTGSLIFDGAGDLYGTANSGGLFDPGAVFELSKTKAGWLETTLYSFGHYPGDGNFPTGNLVFDVAGNLYGTTAAGGGFGGGTVFELSLDVGGGWAEKPLHAFPFPNDTRDGSFPVAGLVIDPAGNLYGTTGGRWHVRDCSESGLRNGLRVESRHRREVE